MQGMRRTIKGSGGVPIGLLTAGSGPPLLLVHGGFGQIERWAPVWELLTGHWRVTAMDRRGRGTSGDADFYEIGQEYGDIAAVATWIADEAGDAIDVFAHSYGATCAIGSISDGAPVRHLVAYEPAGPQTAPQEWVDRVTLMVSSGDIGRAMFSFLTEIIGLSPTDVEALRTAPAAYDILGVVRATMPREAEGLRTLDLLESVKGVQCPITLLVGTKSPPWAHVVADALAGAAPTVEVVSLLGVGHEAIDTAPRQLVEELEHLLLHN